MDNPIISLKQCTKCKQAKPLDQFSKRGDGYTSHCKDCRNNHNREYNKRRTIERAEYARWYRARFPDKVRENNRNWQEANRDKVREKALRYQKKHPEKKRASESKRRAQKRKSAGVHTPDDIALLYKSQRGKCWWCGKPVGESYHVDHRIPLSRGGSNAVENLCITCPECNWRKYDKLPQEWNGRLL